MLACPGRRFRLRLKTSVTAVLLISVFLSSSILVQSAHASTATDPLFTNLSPLTMIPNVGSCNPFANSLAISEGFLYASGYEDLSTNNTNSQSGDGESSITGSGQVVREAAVYANGNEPMAVAIVYASLTGELPNGVGGLVGETYGLASAFLLDWPYLIFDKTTGKPLDSKTYYSNIPLDLNYRFSMTPTGWDALAQGIISFGNNITAEYEEGIGESAGVPSGGSPEGTLSFNYSGYGGSSHYLIIEATAIADSEVSLDAQGYGVNSPVSEAQAVVDPYLYVDPSSPLAGQMQVYVGTTANANPSDPSQWTPSVQTPIDLNNILPLATPFANSTASPSSSSTPTVSTSPIVPEFSSKLLGITLVASMLIVLSAVIIAKKKITWKTQRGQHS